MTAPEGLRRVVIAGGSGAVGSLFARELRRQGAAVCVIDGRVPAPGEPTGLADTFLPGDITTLTASHAAALGAADMVMLAVPEPVVITAAPTLASHVQPGALVVDTSSVKSGVVGALEQLRGDVEVLSLNPMFAPSLGFDGRSVAAVPVRSGPRSQHLLQSMRQWGAAVVEVSAEEHDRLTAASQALTHAALIAFGLALADLGVDGGLLDRLVPPPSSALTAFSARVAAGVPEVYWNIQAANPYAGDARRALAQALHTLDSVVDSGSEDGFGHLLERMRSGFGPTLDHHVHVSQTLCRSIARGSEGREAVA